MGAVVTTTVYNYYQSQNIPKIPVTKNQINNMKVLAPEFYKDNENRFEIKKQAELLDSDLLMMERDYYLYTKTPDEAMGHDVTFVYGAKKGYEAGSKVSFQNSKSVTKNTNTEIKDQKSVDSQNHSTSTDKIQSEKVQLHEGKQGKHILGHNNYIEGKSEVDMETAKNVLNNFQGKGVLKNNGQREIVDTEGKYTGIFVDENTGQRSLTSRFTIHYDSKGTAHVVPANPNQK